MPAEFAYIFPNVLPKDETLFPLVQLFAGLVYLAPAENDLPWQDTLPPLASELLAQGLLRCHCPAPLGADRERFFRLLAELQQRPGEHAALFVAGNGEPERQEEIISAVRRQKSDAAGAERLWQARLLLKLGEIVERQEEEICQSLRQIALREKELLCALRDEQPAVPLHDAPTAQPDNRRSKLLLKAWQTLLASGPLLTNVFVTADREAFAAVIEASEAELRQTVSLLLPALPAGVAVAEQRSRFQQATAELRNNLPAAVDQERWEAVLEQHYPAAVHGRCRLMLHVVQGCCFGLIGQNMLIGFLEQAHERD